MSHPDQPERAAIQAAAQRLLQGTPLRSTGALTVVGLAAEAGVKRWLLTHKHRDLAEQFQTRAKAAGGDPRQVVDLKARIQQLTDDNTRLRKENTEQHALTEYYANVINELATALDHVTAEQGQAPDNVRSIIGLTSRTREPNS